MRSYAIILFGKPFTAFVWLSFTHLRCRCHSSSNSDSLRVSSAWAKFVDDRDEFRSQVSRGDGLGEAKGSAFINWKNQIGYRTEMLFGSCARIDRSA